MNQTKFESGGTLVFSENLGGHTIRNHVSRTDAQLLERLSTDLNIQGSSTFTDLSTAERAIGEVLTRNRAEIQDFFGNSSGNRLPLSETLDFDVGRGFNRESINPQISNSLQVILDRDELSINGFRIHTAYPRLQ
ncbi:RNase A-like domain-containing protein [Agaribacter flavus]|uniref:RNase A-like domain-containing protein n=1 Tax=Agaribacter flavus TaxID=1902781 RepID=A0ABV7FKV5_9ALTE